MSDLKCTCPTTKSRIDEVTQWSFCFRQFIHSFADCAYSSAVIMFSSKSPHSLGEIRRSEVKVELTHPDT